MPRTYRVRVLSSYINDRESSVAFRDMSRDNRWFHGFTRAVVRQGSSLNDFDIEFVRLPAPPAPIDHLADAIADDTRLVICAGIDAAIRWAPISADTPTLYFGGHPDNNGLDVVARDNVRGVRLNLPLIWTFDNFSLIRALVPDVADIFIPVNLQSTSAYPHNRANYEAFRRQHAERWIAAPSGHLGFRSVYFLADRLGCRYHEGPFAGLDELRDLLRGVTRGRHAAVIGFNDTVLIDGAADLILETVREGGNPLFWVNNWPIVKAGGVADFSSDFEKVGETLGEMALRVLREREPIGDLPYAADPGERFALNLARCANLGLDVPDPVRARFHLLQRS